MCFLASFAVKALTAKAAKDAKKTFQQACSRMQPGNMVSICISFRQMKEQEEFFHIEQLDKRRAQAGKLYMEFLRLPAMSAGVYTLPAGGVDLQKPHAEDELYYVVRGRARMRVGLEDRAIRQGSVIFVAANVEHRFYDIAEELVLFVFFAPAET
jgi:mannose-6-phosphate isomerase-like protein (cupin superfamily)